VSSVEGTVEEHQQVAYDERLTAPVWVWAAVLSVAGVSAAALHGGAGGWRTVVPYAVLLPLAVAGLLWTSRGRVRVADGVLHVPGARIPLDHLGGVTPLTREGTRRVRGPLAEPRAYVVTRGWLSESVRVQVEDPEDDTPYWLVGTRRPEQLAAALQRR
jgi:Protein of unknown function (DUF3093)